MTDPKSPQSKVLMHADARCNRLLIGALCARKSILAIAVVVGLSPVIAGAQAVQLDEIVVTAQKRTQNLQDVGVAVTALSPAALQMVDTKDATQLAAVVPSLQVQQFSPSVTVYNIRGVSQNDYSDFQEGPIAFYNDEVYISSLGAIAGQTFDVQRVEVLRGPQGTLFGRNATGGLVQVITNKPTSTWQGYGTVTLGRYNELATEFGVGGPIADHVRFRIAGTTDRHDGYYTNLFPGSRDGGDAKFYAGRAQFEFDVVKSGTLLLKAELLRNDHENAGAISGTAAKFDADGLGVPLAPNENFYGTCPGCTVFGYRFPDNPYVNSLNFDGIIFDRTFWNWAARYQQRFDGFTLTSITSYQDLDKQWGNDIDSTPFTALHISTTQGLHQVSQELRVDGSTKRLSWLAGVYGLKINTDVSGFSDVDPVVLEFLAHQAFGTFGSQSLYLAKQETKSVAAFAQGEYQLTDLFKLIVGGRYGVDKKDDVFTHRNLTFGIVDYDFAARRPDLASQRFNDWSGKLQLEAKLGDDALLYIGVNRGTKSGGFNAPRVIPSPFQYPTFADYLAALNALDISMVFRQEVLTNYEGGFKLAFADRKATLNGSVFHYDYDDYQSFQNNNANLLVFNVPAKLTGMELEASMRSFRALNLSVFVTHMFQAKVQGIALPSGRVTDTRMPQVPKWSVGGMVSWEIPVASYGAITLATNWKYDSSQYFTPFNAMVDREGARTVGNVRASFATPNRFEVALFVNNVTDRQYRVFSSDNSSLISVTENTWARPRWYGGSVSYRF